MNNTTLLLLALISISMQCSDSDRKLDSRLLLFIDQVYSQSEDLSFEVNPILVIEQKLDSGQFAQWQILVADSKNDMDTDLNQKAWTTSLTFVPYRRLKKYVLKETIELDSSSLASEFFKSYLARRNDNFSNAFLDCWQNFGSPIEATYDLVRKNLDSFDMNKENDKHFLQLYAYIMTYNNPPADIQIVYDFFQADLDNIKKEANERIIANGGKAIDYEAELKRLEKQF